MNFIIPLFPETFQLFSLEPDFVASPGQLKTLDQIETRLNIQVMSDVIKEMHAFYAEGQKHLIEILPKMIELGAMTQEQFNDLQKDSPSIESSDDYVSYLEGPFQIHIGTPENCTEGTFGLTSECKWDPEHGVGVWFENWKPVRVGFAEAGYPF